VSDARALPEPLGIRHVALRVHELERVRDFYVDVLGYRVEWSPSPDECYLTRDTGDNLALHRRDTAPTDASRREGVLDHFGFVVRRAEDVDAYYAHFVARGVPCEKPPRTHRDGARSFYARDPEGTVVQVIYHPPISDRAP
jgi:catechol 2,3-dioxygenase-like lactoylglutathione lyase family enzyme